MIDAEVLRLRKLRIAVLRARALAYRLDGEQGRDDSIFSRTALTCWGIARYVTGYLSAHPNLRCQEGPSRRREWVDRLSASVTALATRQPAHRVRVLMAELERAARELDDVRAVTRSPELSDVLGRQQINVRRLLGRPARANARVNTSPIGLADNWPYMTI
jgi:hypothetical protein